MKKPLNTCLIEELDGLGGKETTKLILAVSYLFFGILLFFSDLYLLRLTGAVAFMGGIALLLSAIFYEINHKPKER